MLQSLNHLTLAVSNLQSSLTFWRDLLGLQLHAEWDTGAYLWRSLDLPFLRRIT